MSDLTLTILVGLPGSGKTTWATEQVAIENSRTVRLNRDDLRQMLHGGVYSKENELIVRHLRNVMISTALANSLSVIIDDTNTRAYQRQEIGTLADVIHPGLSRPLAVSYKYFDTPLDECIRRDALRENPVGRDKIIEMADKMDPLPDNQ